MPITVKFTAGRHVGTRRGCAGKVFGDTEEEARSRAADIRSDHPKIVREQVPAKKKRRKKRTT